MGLDSWHISVTGLTTNSLIWKMWWLIVLVVGLASATIHHYFYSSNPPKAQKRENSPPKEREDASTATIVIPEKALQRFETHQNYKYGQKKKVCKELSICKYTYPFFKGSEG